MNLLVWRCFENLVFIIKGKMRWSSEFRPANRRRWKEKEWSRSVTARTACRIRQIPVDIFISQPRVDSGEIAAKGKRFISHSHTHTHKHVSSSPHRRCIKATPSPGNKGSRQASPMCRFHCTARSDARCAHSDRRLCLLVSILEAELCTNAGFRCASSCRGADFVMTLPGGQTGLQRCDYLHLGECSVMFPDSFPCELKSNLWHVSTARLCIMGTKMFGNSSCAH